MELKNLFIHKNSLKVFNLESNMLWSVLQKDFSDKIHWRGECLQREQLKIYHKHSLKKKSKAKIKVAQACTILCAWTIQSMEFSRPEYKSGLPWPSPGDLSNPGIKSRSPSLQSHQESPRIMEWVACPFYRGTSWPGIKPGSPASQADSLPAEWPGKHPQFSSVQFSRSVMSDSSWPHE